MIDIYIVLFIFCLPLGLVMIGLSVYHKSHISLLLFFLGLGLMILPFCYEIVNYSIIGEVCDENGYNEHSIDNVEPGFVNCSRYLYIDHVKSVKESKVFKIKGDEKKDE
jgi:hypothetical protein